MRRRDARVLLLASWIVCASCVAHSVPEGELRVPDSPPRTSVVSIPIRLPDSPAEGVAMDYILYEKRGHRVWVPAGNTGSVDVIDVADRRVTQVKGFPTSEVERRGQKRTIGPSSATEGRGTVYIGNRADSSVCEVDPSTLRKGACITLDSSPDGIAYVASTREVWVTTPRTNALVILDVHRSGDPKVAGRIALDGLPEGYAVDEARGLFFTNFEDKDLTVAIDIRSRKVRQSFPSGCGADGPRGLALDPEGHLLLVACPDHLAAIDPRSGRTLSTLPTGGGVDAIDYDPSHREVFAAAARDGSLTVAHLNRRGRLARIASLATEEGARNAVVADGGWVYVPSSSTGEILVLKARRDRP